MSYMKLIKLLYLADREALLRWGRPITTDRYVSIDHGPVVSNVYELIRAEPQPGRGQYWRRFVSAPDGNYDVSLLATPEPAELSQAEDLLLREIFALHGANTPGTMLTIEAKQGSRLSGCEPQTTMRIVDCMRGIISTPSKLMSFAP